MNRKNKRQAAGGNKKIFTGSKNFVPKLTKESKQLKECITAIKQQQQQQQQQHWQRNWKGQRQQQGHPKPKEYKKVVYEEATDSEPEAEEEEAVEIKEIKELEKNPTTTTSATTTNKIKIFDYLNSKDANRTRK